MIDISVVDISYIFFISLQINILITYIDIVDIISIWKNLPFKKIWPNFEKN